MSREDAIEKILADLKLPRACEDYVLQTIALLGCDDTLDNETVVGVERVIKSELSI